MSQSSGQRAGWGILRNATCGNQNTNTIQINGRTLNLGTWPCTFEGEVDVMTDPEIRAALWVCPVCDHEHDISEGWYA